MNDPKTWHPQPKIYKSPPFSVEAPGYQQVDGETIPRRNVASKDKLRTRPEEGIATIYDLMRVSAKKYGNAKALGHRKVVRMHEEVKKIKKMVDGKEQETEKKWTYFELSEYHYLSFTEFERTALQCGAGMRKLGMEATDRLHIFAATRYLPDLPQISRSKLTLCLQSLVVYYGAWYVPPAIEISHKLIAS